MIRRVETVGSVFEFDEQDRRYRRWPKSEAPRERPEWGTTRGPLMDAVWHPFVDWSVETGQWGVRRLLITVARNDDGTCTRVSAPIPIEAP